MYKFISDNKHYSEVIEHSMQTKQTLWIGTADIKDLYISNGKTKKPFLGVLSELIGSDVNVLLIHAKEPGQAFREDFDKNKHLSIGLERVLCPRVHFKIIVIDCKTAYIGSANLTGAGMGMKSSNRRNFEAGIITDDPELVAAAMEEFDKVWRGEMCKKCKRKQYCGDPIVSK